MQEDRIVRGNDKVRKCCFLQIGGFVIVTRSNDGNLTFFLIDCCIIMSAFVSYEEIQTLTIKLGNTSEPRESWVLLILGAPQNEKIDSCFRIWMM